MIEQTVGGISLLPWSRRKKAPALLKPRFPMNGKTAAFIFVGVCVILAVLLLTGFISPIVSGSVFAVALVLLGGMSGGFRKKNPTNPPGA